MWRADFALSRLHRLTPVERAPRSMVTLVERTAHLRFVLRRVAQPQQMRSQEPFSCCTADAVIALLHYKREVVFIHDKETRC